ncbi:MAG: hypothetical protein WC346_12935 [Methanogenium sp.]|jgi:hypothetical protein
MEKVILRPISRNKWAGISKYKGCYTYLAPYLTRSGSLYTGLSTATPEERATKERLEQALGQDLSPMSKFWESYFIRIGSTDIFIDPSTPRGELDYLFLKKHKRIASTVNKVLPSHDFVLIDENEEAKVVNEYNRNKRQAFKELDKMSPSDKRRALRIYGFNPETSTDEMIENRLTDLIEKDPKKFFSLWVDNKKRDTEFLIKQGVALNVLSKNKTVYKYGQDVIGHTLEDAIDYLDNPINQETKIAIQKNINSIK